MNIVKATKRFEHWLARHTNVVEADLRLKHERMAESPFLFLRATFYRWIEQWRKGFPDLAVAPEVLAVGDLHVENFGTWRDKEGRLIWGVNDFDEAYSLPYTNDLLRLTISAVLAIRENRLSLPAKAACEAILEGYLKGLRDGGRPFVLGEHHCWLRDIAHGELRNPVRFWAKMDALPVARGNIPVSALSALEHLLPEPGLKYKLVRRVAGLGSLGHQRLVALCNWRGGRIAREAKSLVPSACCWADDSKGMADIQYQTIITHAVRCPDPFVELRGHWIVRRLAPDCSRIELAALPVVGDELKLLAAMGWETANIHLGTPGAARRIRAHFNRQKTNWLSSAMKTGIKALCEDWHAWKRAMA
ncbi:MAG: DUF2252 family protein [Acidobacteria bacterium]|nr:DUF2252 family protein [Acidobacteriota bacterium]